jgi:hypothetical protein
VLTYVLGPMLALLPQSWRDALPLGQYIRWKRATVVSGLGESVLALMFLTDWYLGTVPVWIGKVLDVVLSTNNAKQISDHQIGFTGLLLFLMHPLTWVFFYFGAEGAVRLLAAAFTDSCFGTLPLGLIDKAISGLWRAAKGQPLDGRENSSGNFSEWKNAVRDKVLIARAGDLPDELCFRKNGAEDTLEISASRPKQDWNPPRTIRYADSYYRLEESMRGGGLRPFRYVLRRLPAGVPGRTVLIYAPEDFMIRDYA